jgi:hypothetical protein
MNNKIKFEIKQEKDLCSLMIYRAYKEENKGTKWSYIDSCHPMSKMELHTLKNFLQEYLHNNDWY